MTPKRFEKIKATLIQRQPDLTVLAADIHKTHNISAILRTCDATGIFQMHAVSPNGEIRRHHMVSGGSQRWVDVKTHKNIDDAVKALHSDGWLLVAAHPCKSARDFREIDYTKKIALLLGSELDGLTPQTVQAADETIELPMEGMVASVNVSVAAAVILYEAQRQRRVAGMFAKSRLSRAAFETTLFEWSYPEIAERCKIRGLPYPELTEEGAMKSNPLT